MDFVDAELARHRFGRRLAVAGQHDDANAVVVQLANRLGRRRLDRIGHADQTRQLFFDGDEHHRLALGAQLLRRDRATRRRRFSVRRTV